MASERAAVSGPKRYQTSARGALVDGACELVESELIAAASRRRPEANVAGAEALAAAIGRLWQSEARDRMSLVPKLPPRPPPCLRAIGRAARQLLREAVGDLVHLGALSPGPGLGGLSHRISAWAAGRIGLRGPRVLLRREAAAVTPDRRHLALAEQGDCR